MQSYGRPHARAIKIDGHGYFTDERGPGIEQRQQGSGGRGSKTGWQDKTGMGTGAKTETGAGTRAGARAGAGKDRARRIVRYAPRTHKHKGARRKHAGHPLLPNQPGRYRPDIVTR